MSGGHVSVTTDGRFKRAETSNKALATTIEAKIRTEIVEGKYFERPIVKKRTFRDLVERYLREWTVMKAQGSQDRDKGIFKNHLVPEFGDIGICDVSPDQISRYKLKRKEVNASLCTINKELGLMRAAYNVAIRKWDWTKDNPVSRVALKVGIKSKNGEPRTIPLNNTALKLLIQKSKVTSLSRLVFVNSKSDKIDKANLRRAYTTAIDKAGIKDFRFQIS